MTPTRRDVLCGLSATVGAGLAGCAGALTGADSTTAGSVTRQVGMACTVGQENYRFTPAVVQVPVGGEVSWGATSTCRQVSTAYHPRYDGPLRIPEAAEPWQSPILKEGQGTFAHRFEVEGVYDYHGLFEEFGQVGTVVVGNPTPDPSAEPGLTPPSPSLPAPTRRQIRSLNDRVRDVLAD
ncbi:MAG: halocyanin [Halobacteriaceae archaeon]